MSRENLNQIDIDADIEHLLWINVRVEFPEFLEEEPEDRIEDAFVPDEIETL